MRHHFFERYNNDRRTTKHIFHKTHRELVKSGGEWLASLILALWYTVASATSATVPGGNHGDKGNPVLQNQPAFTIFSLSSLIAPCSSVIYVVMFLTITSRYEERDFRSRLPWKILIGMSSLFLSIVAMLVSFCAGHFFLLDHKLQNAAIPLYVALFLPVTFIFAIGQLPLYIDLLQTILRKVPQRSSKVIISD